MACSRLWIISASFMVSSQTTVVLQYLQSLCRWIGKIDFFIIIRIYPPSESRKMSETCYDKIHRNENLLRAFHVCIPFSQKKFKLSIIS
jgi:hypothetical protein